MKIIKRKKKHLWVECDHCGSILEPSEKDYKECTDKRCHSYNSIKKNDQLYILTEEVTIRWVDCPVCNHSIKTDRKTKESYEPL